MDDLAALEAAIYDQSFRTLDEQARVLEGLQTRAGTLVGIANVTTAFLGGITLTRGGSTAWPAKPVLNAPATPPRSSAPVTGRLWQEP